MGSEKAKHTVLTATLREDRTRGAKAECPQWGKQLTGPWTEPLMAPDSKIHEPFPAPSLGAQVYPSEGIHKTWR